MHRVGGAIELLSRRELGAGAPEGGAFDTKGVTHGGRQAEHLVDRLDTAQSATGARHHPPRARLQQPGAGVRNLNLQLDTVTRPHHLDTLDLARLGDDLLRDAEAGSKVFQIGRRRHDDDVWTPIVDDGDRDLLSHVRRGGLAPSVAQSNERPRLHRRSVPQSEQRMVANGHRPARDSVRSASRSGP